MAVAAYLCPTVTVARELTKIHEEVARGTAREVRDHFAQGTVRGEFVVVVRGIGKRRGGAKDDDARDGD